MKLWVAPLLFLAVLALLRWSKVREDRRRFTALTRSAPGDEVPERSEGGQRHRRRRKNAPGYRTEHGKVAREARRRRRELQERVDG